MSEDKIINFYVTSGFGGRTQQPFVQVLIEAADFMTQMSPADARALAFNLLECADAAESDGFLFTFIRKRMGGTDQHAARMLIDFREWRDKQRENQT